MQESSLVNGCSEGKSKIDIIRWINNTLKINLLKIEQLGSGAVFCQLLDSVHPRQVPMNKVNWNALHDYEFIQNFRILQKCLDHLKIDYKLEVNKLIKCKFIDNYELAVWFNKYWNQNNQEINKYDAMARRGGNSVKINLDFNLNYKVCTDDKENRDLISYYSQQKQYITSQKKYQTNKNNNKLSQFQLSNYKINLNENSIKQFNNQNSASQLNSLKNYDKNILNLLQNAQNLRVEDHPIYLNLEEINKQIYQQLADISQLIQDPSINSLNEMKQKINDVIFTQESVIDKPNLVSMFDENEQIMNNNTNTNQNNKQEFNEQIQELMEENLLDDESQFNPLMEIEDIKENQLLF